MKARTFTPKGRSNRAGMAMLALCSLAAGAISPVPVQASILDGKMIEAANEALKECKKQGWKNVGVLNFQVQVGDKNPTWKEGRLNTFMATRLENALVLKGKNYFGVTRNAGEAALRNDPKVHYLTEEGRKKLFTWEYPLIQGGKQKVDGILTGKVHFSPDLKEMTVTLYGWDKDNPTPPLEGQKFYSFNARTDRVTLAEMNRSFVIPRTLVLTKRDDLEEAAAEGVIEDFPPAGDPLEEYLEFNLRYDGQLVPVQLVDGKYRVETPKEGQTVQMELKATKERIAVIVLVNGVNTYRKEKELEPAQYSRWVLDKVGFNYTIAGFYPTDKAKVEPFQVLGDEESLDYPLADESKRGLVELYVFRENVPADTPTTALKIDGLRGFTQFVESDKQAWDLILAKLKHETGSMGIVMPGDPTTPASITQTEFQAPALVASRVIVYYQKD